jgi:non-ribosomal peptide synthetase component F
MGELQAQTDEAFAHTAPAPLPEAAGTGTGADGERLAYILYTSGSTGERKGVRISQANVLQYCRAFGQEFSPGPGDVMLQNSVCSFDIFVEELFPVLLAGGCIAIPGEDTKADFSALLGFIVDHQVSIVSGFPYLIREFNELEALPASLRLLISGGDVLRAAYVDRLVDRICVYNTYGPSETTVCCAYFHCLPGSELADGTYPVGHPVLGTQLAICDEAGQVLPKGQSGEIYIYGGGVGLGYMNDAQSDTVYRLDADGQRFYQSGDLGYVLPSGDFAFLRRKDAQYMILGKRVELGEVVNVLERLPEVREAVVTANFDPSHLAYLTAYLVPANPAAIIDLQKLRRELADYLTAFMIPEFFVQVQELPKGASGKVDPKALPIVLRGPQVA